MDSRTVSSEQLNSSASSNKVTRLRGRSLPETCKLVYGKAFELSKYDHYDDNGNVLKKGHLFTIVSKKSIPLEEYRKHVSNLLDVFDQLGIQYATSVSQYLRKHYPDSEKTVSRLKNFYSQLESKVATPNKSATEDGSDARTEVYMFDAATKFQTMEAVFTGKDIEEAYDDDRFQLQCEEIEILLNGGQRSRDVGQENEVKQLTQILQGLERNGGISGPVHRHTGTRAGTAMNTVRGDHTARGESARHGKGGAPAKMDMQPPNTARLGGAEATLSRSGAADPNTVVVRADSARGAEGVPQADLASGTGRN
jgi:hypothetical protein